MVRRRRLAAAAATLIFSGPALVFSNYQLPPAQRAPSAINAAGYRGAQNIVREAKRWRLPAAMCSCLRSVRGGAEIHLSWPRFRARVLLVTRDNATCADKKNPLRAQPGKRLQRSPSCAPTRNDVRRGRLFARPIDPPAAHPNRRGCIWPLPAATKKNAIVSINPLAMIPTNIWTMFQGFYLLHHPIPGGIMNI